MKHFKINLFRHKEIYAKNSDEAISKALTIKLKRGEIIMAHDYTNALTHNANMVTLADVKNSGVWNTKKKTYTVTISRDIIIPAKDIEKAVLKSKKIKLARGEKILVIGEDRPLGMVLLRTKSRKENKKRRLNL